MCLGLGLRWYGHGEPGAPLNSFSAGHAPYPFELLRLHASSVIRLSMPFRRCCSTDTSPVWLSDTTRAVIEAGMTSTHWVVCVSGAMALSR